MEPKATQHYRVFLSNISKEGVASVTVHTSPSCDDPAPARTDDARKFSLTNNDNSATVVLGENFGSYQATSWHEYAAKKAWIYYITPFYSSYKPIELTLDTVGSKYPEIKRHDGGIFDYVGKTKSRYEAVPTTFGTTGLTFDSVFEVSDLDTDNDGDTDIVLRRKISDAKLPDDIKASFTKAASDKALEPVKK